LVVLKTTVFASGAVTLARYCSSWARNREVTALNLGSNISWYVYTTSSEVIGCPSDHLASRSLTL